VIIPLFLFRENKV